MRATKQSVLALAATLLLCIAATVGLLCSGRDTPGAAQQSIYYFTNYASPAQLTAASVENETGSIVLAQTNGGYYAMTGEISGSDDAAVAGFFDAACHIPLSQAVEGASASDVQYGLTAPRAEITLQDVSGGGLVFRLGTATPNGTGVYTCLAGDERVFIMDAAQAELYLSNINVFLDLSLYPSLEGGAINALSEIAVIRGDQVSYRLRQVYANEDGSTVYYAMAQPWQLLLGANQARSAILTPLRQLKGVAVSPLTPAESGLTENSDQLRLLWLDGSSVTVLVGARRGDTTLAMTEGSDRVLCIPTASLSFLDATARDVIGSDLLSLNINDLRTLALNDRSYTIQAESGTITVQRDGEAYDTSTFQNTVFAALNRISVQGNYTEPRNPESELLHIKITTNIADETIDLRFYQLDGRRCAVAINGQMAVWCDLAAVNELLSGAG